MRKEYDKVFLNEYGYYELKEKPALEDRKKEFEEEYYQQSESTYEQVYSEEELRFFNNKLKQKELIIKSNLKKDISKISLLDIGCGEGFVLDYFSRCGADVTGIDFSEWGIKSHNPHMLENFYQGDGLDILPKFIESGKKFDVINMDSVLDMMLEPAKVIRYCEQVLAPDGILVIKVANNYSMLQTTLLESGALKKEYWLDDPGHPSYFNKDGFKKFMEANGFLCVDFLGESFIDFNLLNPLTNYYEKSGVGKECFKAKLQLENMIHDISVEQSLQLFRILGDMGFGREIIGVFVRK